MIGVPELLSWPQTLIFSKPLVSLLLTISLLPLLLICTFSRRLPRKYKPYWRVFFLSFFVLFNCWTKQALPASRTIFFVLFCYALVHVRTKAGRLHTHIMLMNIWSMSGALLSRALLRNSSNISGEQCDCLNYWNLPVNAVNSLRKWIYNNEIPHHCPSDLNLIFISLNIKSQLWRNSFQCLRSYVADIQNPLIK